MSRIELFHYYRQDVISSRYDGGRFFQAGRNDVTSVGMKDILDNVKTLKEESMSLYEVIEESSIIVGRDGRLKKEYFVCIFGDKGEVGFFFQLKAPLCIEEKAGARH